MIKTTCFVTIYIERFKCRASFATKVFSSSYYYENKHVILKDNFFSLTIPHT